MLLTASIICFKFSVHLVKMNTAKSTPLSHLPQQALPPSQEIISGDDDTTIQEVLNQIASSAPQQQPQINVANTQQTPQIPSQLSQQPVTQQQMAFMSAHNAQQLSNLDTNTLLSMIGGSPNTASNVMPTQQPFQQHPTMGATAQPQSNNMMNMLLKIMSSDLKLAAIVFTVYIAISFVPVTRVLERYLSLDKVPHSEVIIKGVLVAILVTLLMKALLM